MGRSPTRAETAAGGDLLTAADLLLPKDGILPGSN